MAARYYQQNIAQYNPLSMEEMMFAPMQMRQRHDLVDQGISEIGTSLGQYNALSQDQPFVQQAIDPVQQELDSLAQELATKGYDQSKMSRLLKLKAQREKLFSPTGDVGIAQSRQQQIQQLNEQINKDYTDPKIRSFYQNRLMESVQGLQRDEQGNILNRNINTPNMVKDYDAETRIKMYNDVLKNVKGDKLFQGYNISSLGDVSRLMTQKSVEYTDADKIMQGMMAAIPDALHESEAMRMLANGVPTERVQEIMTKPLYSIEQNDKGKVTKINYNTENPVIREMLGMANLSEYRKEDVKINQFTDPDAAYRREKEEMESLLLPGALLENSLTPFENLEYKNGRVVTNEKNSAKSFIKDPSNITGFNYYDDQGNIVEANEAIASYTPGTGFGAPLIPKLKQGYKKIPKGTDAESQEQRFLQIREQSDYLKSLPKEKAFEAVKEYYKNVSKAYSTIDAFTTNFTTVKTSLVNNMPNQDFMNTKGQIMNFVDLAESFNMTEKELMDNFTPTGTGVRPKIGAVIEGHITDKKDNKIPIFMRADERSSAMTNTTTSVLNYFHSGGQTGRVPTQYDDPVTEKSITGIETYILNDFGGNPIVLQAPADLTQNQLNELLKLRDPEKIKNQFDNPSRVKIQTLTGLVDETAKQMRLRIQNSSY